LRFADADGDPVASPSSSAPLALTTDVPVRGVASLDLPRNSLVTGSALRDVVRAVVDFDARDFPSTGSR